MNENLTKIFSDVAGSLKSILGDETKMRPADFTDKILRNGEPRNYTVETVEELNDIKYVTPGSTATVGKDSEYSYNYEEKSWTSNATHKIISINDYYHEHGDTLPAGTFLAFRRPASGEIENVEGGLMLDLNLVNYQDVQIRFSFPGTTDYFNGVYGQLRKFVPQLEDMAGSFMESPELREKVIMEYYPSLDKDVPIQTFTIDELMMGKASQLENVLLVNFIPDGEEYNAIYKVQNIDTLWPNGFAYIKILEDVQLFPAWINDNIVYEAFKDFFCVVVDKSSSATEVKPEV